jgi:hypothetical protein
VCNVIPIRNIANKLLEIEVYNKNGNISELANMHREFISKFVLGGRCMCRDNQKQIREEKVVDFDAVSRYPSVMNILYVLGWFQYVINAKMLEPGYILSLLFEDEQIEPIVAKFMSGFCRKIEITKIGVARHFPLINNGEGYFNNLCHMFVDHITLQNLI